MAPLVFDSGDRRGVKSRRLSVTLPEIKRSSVDEPQLSLADHRSSPHVRLHASAGCGPRGPPWRLRNKVERVRHRFRAGPVGAVDAEIVGRSPKTSTARAVAARETNVGAQAGRLVR